MAATNNLPDPPPQLKAIQPYMRIAADVDRVDPIVGYWVRLFSTETALKIDKGSPECQTFLSALISWLEKFKQGNNNNEAMSNQTVGQAHVENFVIALFNKADTLDRDGKCDKTTVRMFYMASILFEAMAVFGPLTEEVQKRAKYAKFKAAYIQKCLKNGETPIPGPLDANEQTASDNQTQQPKDSVGGSSSGPDGGFELPQVPTDTDAGEPPTRVLPPELPKHQDPFVMSPGSPPKSLTQPKFPPAMLTSPTQIQQPQQPTPAATPSGPTKIAGASTISATKFHATNGAPINPEDILQGQKYCKFANSALQYDDITTAVGFLEKALNLLKLGQRSD